MHVIRVLYVFKVHYYLSVTLRRGGEVVLVQEGLEGSSIFNGRMGLEGSLFALPINLKHHVLAPFVVCKSGGEFIGDAGHLPVYVALLPHPIEILWHKPVIALHVKL